MGVPCVKLVAVVADLPTVPVRWRPRAPKVNGRKSGAPALVPAAGVASARRAVYAGGS